MPYCRTERNERDREWDGSWERCRCLNACRRTFSMLPLSSSRIVLFSRRERTLRLNEFTWGFDASLFTRLGNILTVIDTNDQKRNEYDFGYGNINLWSTQRTLLALDLSRNYYTSGISFEKQQDKEQMMRTEMKELFDRETRKNWFSSCFFSV